MAKDGRFRVLATLWVAGLAILVGTGGYNFVNGKQQVLASAADEWYPQDDETESALELATLMGRLQHHTHKLNLTLQAENLELARFYLDETDQILQQIDARFPVYENFPVSSMVRAFAFPPLAALSDALHEEDWSDAARRYEELVAACNQCHRATAHPFIEIVVSTSNPFNQSFER
ncbi:MAG: hypothetical protein HRU01_30290 [Myxococcales bacterium]|nr:hypothetical protein [Myxococcales bacterium]